MDTAIDLIKNKPGVGLMIFGVILAMAALGVESFMGVKFNVGDENAVMWLGFGFAAIGALYSGFRTWIDYKREALGVDLKKANIAAGRPDEDKTIIRGLTGDDE